jgi:hypothetical protein
MLYLFQILILLILFFTQLKKASIIFVQNSTMKPLWVNYLVPLSSNSSPSIRWYQKKNFFGRFVLNTT